MKRQIFWTTLFITFVTFLSSCNDSDSDDIPEIDAKIMVNGAPLNIYGVTVDLPDNSKSEEDKLVHVDFILHKKNPSGIYPIDGRIFRVGFSVGYIGEKTIIDLSDKNVIFSGWISTGAGDNGIWGNFLPGISSGTVAINLNPTTKDVFFDFDAKAVADSYDEEMNQEPNLFDVVGVVTGKGYFNDKY